MVLFNCPKVKKTAFLYFLLLTLLLPLVVLSQGSNAPVQIPNPLICDTVECLVQKITDAITGLVTIIGTIMIIIGGIQFITSAGNEEKARHAKNTILYAVIGIAIAVSVDFIVGFLREILGRGG